jgi:apolipoprotein N-acyltransferase
VRAANTGITAVIDPRGRVLDPTRLYDTTLLVRDVPLVAEPTFYARYGDLFAQAASAAALALVAATFGRHLRP